MGDEVSDWRRRTRKLQRGGKKGRSKTPKVPRPKQKPKSKAKQAKAKQREKDKATRAKKNREEGLKRKAAADKQKKEGTFKRKSKKEKREERRATRKKRKEDGAAQRKKKNGQRTRKRDRKGPAVQTSMGNFLKGAMNALQNALAALGAAMAAIAAALAALLAGIMAAISAAIDALKKLFGLFDDANFMSDLEGSTPQERDQKCDDFLQSSIGKCRETRLKEVMNICSGQGYSERCVGAFDEIYHKCTRPAEEARLVCRKATEMAVKNPAGAKAYVKGEMARIQQKYGKETTSA